MEGSIIDENNKGVAVDVIDNNGETHEISMFKDGEITYHDQDGYPDDPADRSGMEESEPINQARRFAKYWVYRERGYDTLSLNENPHRVAAAALVVAGLTESQFEEYFTDLFLQVGSHYGDTPRQVPLPEGAMPTKVTYQKDVYLGLNDDALATLAAAVSDPDTVSYLMDLRNDTTDTDGDRSIEAVLDGLLERSDAVGDLLVDLPADTWIEAVSDIHVFWDDVAGQYHTEWGDQPDIDRNPDARIDIMPYDPDSLAAFRTQLIHTLFCQVRDVYLGMGIAPPAPFRLQGLGIYEYMSWYEHFDYYDRYHDPEADVSTWYEEHTPDGVYDLPAFENKQDTVES